MDKTELLLHIDPATHKYGILFTVGKSTFGLLECIDLQQH